jgi:hypothetical protein
LKHFKHRPHNPDLALRDDHLFLHLKTLLAGQSLRGDQESKRRFAGLLKGLAANFFDEG